MSATPPYHRNPLVISGNSLSSGDRTTTFRRGDAGSLLRSYLIFVRDLRGQRREPSIELRSEDITVLSAHLGVTEQLVLGGLLDLMGATQAQRNTMLAMLAAGALTLVLSGSIVSGLSNDGVSVEFGRLADAVQAAVGDTAPASATTASSERPSHALPTSAPTPAAAVPGSTESATGSTTASTRSAFERSAFDTPRPDVLRSAAAPSAAATDVGRVADEPVSIGIAPDGSLVASVAPPVPAGTDEPVATAQLPDGTTVGVAAPPVPPATGEPVATAELPDGTMVGVAAPPVPPTP